MSGTESLGPEDVLQLCQAAAERGDTEVIEQACREHPDLAVAIRSLVEVVRSLGAHAAVVERLSVRRDLVVPERIGRYRILSEIGRGGSSVVYAAEDPQLGRIVALKVLALAPSAESAERFRREARALAALRHPNIAAVHEAGETPDGLSYIAMDFVDGVSLGALLGRFAGRDPAGVTATELPLGEGEERASFVTTMVRWAARIAGALEHAHASGVVHRDVKPANILIDRKGSPCLVDFGLARGADAQTVTRTGVAPGTPLYMAPEQVSGGRGAIGPQADVYALGVTLYHALTLRPPFAGETTEQVFDQICRVDPVSPRSLNPGVSRDLETVVLTAMEKDPAQRFASAAAFREDLEALLDLRPIKARPPGWLARSAKWSRRHPAASAAIAVVVVGIVSTWALSAWQVRREGYDALASFRVQQGELARREQQLAPRVASLMGYVSVAERGRIAAEQAGVGVARLAMERDLVTACDRLGQSLDQTAWLGPLNRELRRTLCGALLERSALLAARGNEIDARALADRARDVAGESWQDWTWGHVTLACPAPGAVAYLYRYDPYELARPGAIPRLVPVPIGPEGRTLDVELGPGFRCGDPCLLVTEVEPGSAAERAGLQPGDLIYRVGDDDLLEQHLYVATVAPGGAADVAGVRPFDRIECINHRDAIGLWTWEMVPQPAMGETLVVCRIDGGSGRRIVVEGRVPAPDYEQYRWLASSILATNSRLARADACLDVATIESVLGFSPAEVPELLASGVPRGTSFRFLHDGRAAEGRCDAGEPLGASLEWTAYPLARDSRNRVALDDRPTLWLGPGSYLALLEAPGRMSVRRPFLVTTKETDDAPPTGIRIEPPPAGEGPPGFVYVAGGDVIVGGEPDVTLPQPRRLAHVKPFFLARFEVSTREWYEFVNETSPPTPDMSPKEKIPSEKLPLPTLLGNCWANVGAQGWVPSSSADDETAIVGIDSDGPVHWFLEWKNQRAAASGWRYRLPSPDEWEYAARGADGRAYPWGDRFDPTFCNSLVARDADVEKSCMQEPRGRFPWDESPFGLRDMAGGAVEANTGDVSADRTWTPLRGGSWVMANPAYFKAASRVPSKSDVPERGLRLVAERDEHPGS